MHVVWWKRRETKTVVDITTVVTRGDKNHVAQVTLSIFLVKS